MDSPGHDGHDHLNGACSLGDHLVTGTSSDDDVDVPRRPKMDDA